MFIRDEGNTGTFSQNCEFKAYDLCLKHTFAAIQKNHKPSNINKNDKYKINHQAAFYHFCYFNFKTRFNTLHSVHIKER